MIWESWADFFAMGGYALYVWGSIIVVAICLLGELIALRLRKRSIRSQFAIARRSGNLRKAGRP